MSSREDTHERRAKAEIDSSVDETTLQAGESAPSTKRPADQLKRGATVDRYVILAELGAGGMGVVYAAYDPNLDRRIALKLIAAETAGPEGSSAGHARTLREAQAMARLSHPNVVTVHDVGSADGTVYIAMELVEGQTLTEWFDGGRRRWSEVLAVFEAAGAGLVAAHEAGLVHRDFKPDNVMLGNDGRLRVMDFGLARNAGESPTGAERKEWSSDHGDVDRLTRTGAIVGTPAYMAPEVLKGGAGDARSDQFAFCVALFRGLYGIRPFEGANLAELLDTASHGRVVSVPIAKVPRWIGSTVRRGLSANPDRRFASMQALLHALSRGRRRRTRILAGLGVLVVAAAASGASLLATASACSGGGARVESIWNAVTREQIGAAFVATGAVQAQDASGRVFAGLDAHAEAWEQAYRSACDANHRGEQSDDLLDRRMACLGHDLTEFEALLDALRRADRAMVAQAVLAVGELGDVDECEDVAALVDAAHAPKDAATRQAVEALRGRLARARGLLTAGEYAQAYDLVSQGQAAAQATGFRPLIAEFEFASATLALELGRPLDSLAHAERACFEAEASGDALTAARAWAMRIHLEGMVLAKHEAGLEAVRRADAAVIRKGDRIDLRVGVTYHRAGLELELGHYEDGLALHQEALQLAELDEGPQSQLAARSHGAIGNALFHLGRASLARQSYERAYAILVELLGEQHPECAEILENIGTMELMLGDIEVGRAKLEQALEVLERTLGPDHTRVGEVLFNLGWAAQKAGQFEDGLAYFERARAVELPRLGPGHPLLGQYEASIAVLLQDLGRHEEARTHLQVAQKIFIGAHGPDHNFVARVEHDLANAAKRLGDTEAAVKHYERAIEIRRVALPADHPELADSLERLITLQLDADEFDAALPLVVDLVRARTAHEADNPGDVFDALMLAGDVHRGLGDPSSARQHYAEALRRAESRDPAAAAQARQRLAALPP